MGVITRAEIVGTNVELGGYLFARDFPEIVEEIANSEVPRSRSIDSSRESIWRFYTLRQWGRGVQGKTGGDGLSLRSSLRARRNRFSP